MDKPVLTFRVFQGESLVRRETVRQEIVKIGSDPRSHLRIDGPGASRMHAVLEVASPSDLTLIDLGNDPCTRVNGQPINKCRLREGDRIEIAGVTLELERAATEPAFAPIAPAFAPAPPFALSPHNPFLPPSPVLAVEQPMPADGELALMKSGPAVRADEVEESHVTAIEVMVKWGTNVLHVEHLSPVRSFYVGETSEKGAACDFLLPSDVLRATRAPVVIERAGGAWVVVPAGATGTVAMPNEASQPIDAFVAAGRAKPSIEVSGAHEIELLPGTRATVTLASGDISFEVSAVNAGKKIAAGLLPALEASAYKQIGLSLFAHLGIVAAFAFFMPRLAPDDSEAIDRDRIAYMTHMLDASQVREQEEQPEQASAQDSAPTGGDGQSAKGAAGAMGDMRSTAQNKRYSLAGNEDPRLARERALDEARNAPLIGLLAQSMGANTPIAAWGEDTAAGRDSQNFLGQMWGAEPGTAYGVGGLTLSGNEEGGGGKWNGIGLGNVGTIGNGTGCIATPGKPCGIGIGPGGEGIGHGPRGMREHRSTIKAPRSPDVSINGRLPPEVIQRIVRQNFGRFRSCYESALRTNPSLTGRVAVKFVIGRDGAVAMASDGGSDLPDQGVVQCVARSFTNLSFPQPDGGVVTVVYPIVFSPD